MSQPEHHVLFYRAHWRSTADSKLLREQVSLRVPLDHFAHTALHNTIACVPVLDRHTLGRVARAYEPQPEYEDSIVGLINTINVAARHPKVTVFEREIATLTMKAIEAQLPFIQEGLVR